jgi:hypothetical protein
MLPPIKAFGDELSLVEVFVDYDGPQLFSAVGATKTNYLAVHAPRDERGDNWLYVVISKARLRKFSNNEVSVHDAFADPEGGLVRIVSFDAKGNASVATVRANELPEHFIPQDRTVATPSQVLYRRMPAFDLRTLPDELRDATPMWEVSPQTLEYLKSIRTPVAMGEPMFLYLHWAACLQPPRNWSTRWRHQIAVTTDQLRVRFNNGLVSTPSQFFLRRLV